MKSLAALEEQGHCKTKDEDRCLVESLLSLSVKLHKVYCDIDCFEWNEIACGWKYTASFPHYIHVKAAGKPIITEESLPSILKKTDAMNHSNEAKQRGSIAANSCNHRCHQYVIEVQEKYGRNNFQPSDSVPVLKLSHTSREISSRQAHEREKIKDIDTCDEDLTNNVPLTDIKKLNLNSTEECDDAVDLGTKRDFCTSNNNDIESNLTNQQISFSIEFPIVNQPLSSRAFEEKINKLEGELKMDERIKSEMYFLQKIQNLTGKIMPMEKNVKMRCYSSNLASRNSYADLICASNMYLMINGSANSKHLRRKSSTYLKSRPSISSFSSSSSELITNNDNSLIGSALLQRRRKLNISFDQMWFSNQSNVEIIGRKFKD